MSDSALYHSQDRRERFSWAMYDFANSGYTTVVLTTLYSAFFVAVIAQQATSATLLLTIATSIANAVVLFTAPIIGVIGDVYARKKRLLMVTTFGCILFTALLALPGPGDIALAMTILIISNIMFASGENLIAAFLPELAKPAGMGRLSGFGWSVGYIGGLITLVICLAYVTYARANGIEASEFVRDCMLIVATIFALAALPTLLWLKERATPDTRRQHAVFKIAFRRLQRTFQHIHHYPDLLRFMIALTIFHCGIYIVIILAAVYASEVLGFNETDNIILIGVVNISAAIGAYGFGRLQDRIGSLKTLSITLLIWCLAILLITTNQSIIVFWIAANLVGIALGSSQSASRALVGLLSPSHRSGEFFGLWGLCIKLAAIIGPLSYGVINWLNDGDHQISMLVTLGFFVAGWFLLKTIDEQRGRALVARP